MPENETKEVVPHLKWFGIPRIARFIKPHLKLVITVIVTMGLCSAVDSICPLFQDYAITHFIGENSMKGVGAFVAVYLLVLFFQAIMTVIGCYCSWKAEVSLDRDLRQACFDHVQTLSFSYFNQNSVGYIHSRIISDPNRIGGMFSWGLMDSILDLVYIVMSFVIMFSMNIGLGLLLFLVVPLITAVTMFFQKRLTEENRKVRELNSVITGNFNEGITGARTIKSMVIEDRVEEDFRADTLKMKLSAIHAQRLRGLFNSSVVFLSGMALALVLYRGGKLTGQGAMLIGSLSVFMNYATSLGMYVQDLVGTIANFINTQVNIERIDKLLHTTSDVVDSPEVIETYGDSFAPKKENWEDLKGDVEFEDVTFCYPDGEEDVLEHFNLKVPKGSMVAIVGETGAGKSTLVNLVCRFYEPTKGRVLIDGRDARERSQLWLHSHIGYVLQTPHLFGGTVLENLRYGNFDATMEEIEAAVQRVRADVVINRMEKGYESQVGEDGGMLSTGEKQLISFARALLADPKILILDEATSSVDTLTEQTIQNAIGEVTKDRTSFVIAHRLSTIRGADVILAMRDGKIVEQGTHAELMKTKGYYYHLYTRQFMQEQENAVFHRKE